MAKERLEQIDLDKIFKDKNPGLYRFLPGFVMRFLKRIIHQDDLNEFIALANGYFGADFAKAYLDFANITVRIVGEENLPTDNKKVLFASNHPLGGLDGIAVIDQLGHRYPNIKFMVNDILMQVLNLRPVFLAINKHGAMAREATKQIIAAHESENPVFTYPAGLVSRKQGRKIKDPAWGKNVISNAIRYKRDVIPVHISGQNSKFFYNLALWRKRLGIKANLEMLFLVDELWKQNNTTLTITIGEPISYQTFTKEKSRAVWANELRELVYSLVE